MCCEKILQLLQRKAHKIAGFMEKDHPKQSAITIALATPPQMMCITSLSILRLVAGPFHISLVLFNFSPFSPHSAPCHSLLELIDHLHFQLTRCCCQPHSREADASSSNFKTTFKVCYKTAWSKCYSIQNNSNKS